MGSHWILLALLFGVVTADKAKEDARETERRIITYVKENLKPGEPLVFVQALQRSLHLFRRARSAEPAKRSVFSSPAVHHRVSSRPRRTFRRSRISRTSSTFTDPNSPMSCCR